MEQTIYNIIHSLPEYQYIYQSYEDMYNSVRKVLEKIDDKIDMKSAIGFKIDDSFWKVKNVFYKRLKCIQIGSVFDILMKEEPFMIRMFDMNVIFLREFLIKFKQEYPSQKVTDFIPLSVMFHPQQSFFLIGLKITFETDLLEKNDTSKKIILDDKYSITITNKCLIIFPFKQEKLHEHTIEMNKLKTVSEGAFL